MNLNGFYQTNNKSITNTSSSFSNTQSTPPKVNNTTNEFGNEVTFNQGLILPAGSSISIVDGEGTMPLASTDLSDNADIAYLDLVNNFTSLPIFTDAAGIAHQFLIANPDTSTESGKTNHHLSATTTSNNGSNHTTTVVPVPIPSHVTEKVDGSHTHGIAFFSHLDPDGEGPLTHSLAKMSPYRVVTGDANGALIGSYITSDKFASWVFGELTGVKENGIIDPENNRDDTDKYKHGLVPKGAKYIDGEAQEFLRKDGNWQSITDDLSKINGNLQPKPGVSNVNMGTALNTFNTLHINTILCGGTVAGSHGNFTTLNVSGVLEIPNLTVETEFQIGGSFIPVEGNNIEIGALNNKFIRGYFTNLIAGNLQTETINISAGSNFIPSLPGGLGNLPTSEIGSVTHPFAKVYTQNLDTSNRIDTEFIEVKGRIFNNLIPFTDKQGSLGEEAHYWNKLYIETIKADYIHPHFHTSGYLGKADNKWGEAHISTINCDTLTTNTAEISEVGWNNTDLSGTMAVFSHKNRATTNNYAFQQHSGGTTYINSGDTWPDDGTGQINLRINNDNVATFQASLITFIVPTSGPSDRRFKKNITVPLPSKNWTDFKLIEIKQYNKVYPNINSDKLRLGVIAQELEAIDNPICKNAVKEITLEKPTDPVELDIYKQGQIFTDTSGEEHSGGFKAVEYEQLYRMNIVVTQQLMERVEALEAKIISLLDNA